MKATILLCIKNLIREKHSDAIWTEILLTSGLEANALFVPYDDVDDNIMGKIIENTCKLLNINRKQITLAFGEYWMCTYAPKIYQVYFLGKKNSKDMILSLSKIHDMVTKKIPNAHPPKFEYNWIDDNSLIINYLSNRKMIDFFQGLLYGVGKHFNENLKVTQLSDTQVKVVFS